jgi:hypothetical protein
MADKRKSSVPIHRARKERQGFVRVEVNVRKEDASLVRRVAFALSDPSLQGQARKLLRQGFARAAQGELEGTVGVRAAR